MANCHLNSLEVNLERNPCVCILASQRRGTLYTGVTSNLGTQESRGSKFYQQIQCDQVGVVSTI